MLGLLWLMTVALAITFWMNIRYGFNIMSAAHWEYLSTLQASRASIKPEFYLSIIGAIFVGIAGMYLLVRPRFRKIVLTPPAPTQAQIPSATVVPARPKAPTGMRAISVRPQIQKPSNMVPAIAPRPKPLATPPAVQNKEPENPLGEKIKSVFESAGYVMKPCKKLGRLVNPVVALGYDNMVWIGISNNSTENMQDAIQTLVTIFDDTLGDMANDMSLHGCIIKPTESGNNNPDLISTFASIEEFSEFMKKYQNKKPDDFDNELFDAVSTYVTTVTGYTGNA